jgi:hypothetical protein
VAPSYDDIGQRRLAGSFFFSRGSGDVSHAGMFVTSLAMQLAHDVPALKKEVCAAIKESADIVGQSLQYQWRYLVLEPLSRLADSMN